MEPFINSSCPVCEIRKLCPRGAEHSEVALILGFSHFGGLNHKNMLGGSLPCSPGKGVKPIALNLLLFLLLGHVIKSGAEINIPKKYSLLSIWEGIKEHMGFVMLPCSNCTEVP